MMTGLSVVDIADGSVAAQHEGVVFGMLLVAINRSSTAGLGRKELMQAMQSVAMQPRVLTLARVMTPRALPSPCHVPATEPRPDGRPSSVGRSPAISTLESSLVSSSSSTAAPRPQEADRRPTSGELLEMLRPYSALSSSDDDAWSVGGSVATCTPSINSSHGWTPGGENFIDGVVLRRGMQQQRPPARILTLRFVGDQGGISLFDRDHILGLKKRDIEFVPNLNSGPRSEVHRANSRRSLGELTRDWRNDPFSTPARRRRLINDVCKVIVRSYTDASVARVEEFRRQEILVTSIQVVARMWSARRRYAALLAARRARAALSLQLGWLSYLARRRAWVLREERGHVRKMEEAKRVKRMARERAEKRRREEERERERQRRRSVAIVVSVQRRVRAIQVSNTSGQSIFNLR